MFDVVKPSPKLDHLWVGLNAIMKSNERLERRSNVETKGDNESNIIGLSQGNGRCL